MESDDGVFWAASALGDAGGRGGLLTRPLQRVASDPRIYDAIQRLVGSGRTAALLRAQLAGAENKVVLDVGGGTGRLRPLMPPSAKYVWLDNDPRKLEGLKAKWPDAMGVIADATALPFQNASIDFAVCVAVTHHLPDDALRALLGELARVLGETLVLMDAVLCPSRLGRLLWRYDRGSHPRSAEALLSMVEKRFDLESVERYRKYHDYLFCVARPSGGLPRS
jgi:SAM-dependent methyltransferase